MSLIDEELVRRGVKEEVIVHQEGSNFGFGDYVKSKKASLDKYKAKKSLQREVDAQSMKLQAKLDRDSALEDFKKDKVRLKEINQLKKAEKIAMKVRAYEDEQLVKMKKEKFNSSPVGKIVKGFNKLGQGMDSFDNSSIGKSIKNKYSDPFGGSMFDMPQGSKKNRKKRNNGSDTFRL